MTCTPSLRNTSSKLSVNLESRSRSRKRVWCAESPAESSRFGRDSATSDDRTSWCDWMPGGRDTTGFETPRPAATPLGSTRRSDRAVCARARSYPSPESALDQEQSDREPDGADRGRNDRARAREGAASDFRRPRARSQRTLCGQNRPSTSPSVTPNTAPCRCSARPISPVSFRRYISPPMAAVGVVSQG